MDDKNLHNWLALWAVVPEPVKAALMNLALGTLMALRSRQKGILQSTLEVTAGALITLIAGHACKEFGLSTGWTYAASGAIAIFGVDQTKALIAKLVSKKVLDGESVDSGNGPTVQ